MCIWTSAPIHWSNQNCRKTPELNRFFNKIVEKGHKKAICACLFVLFVICSNFKNANLIHLTKGGVDSGLLILSNKCSG